MYTQQEIDKAHITLREFLGQKWGIRTYPTYLYLVMIFKKQL